MVDDSSEGPQQVGSGILMVGAPDLREFFSDLIGDASLARRLETSDICQYYLVGVLAEHAGRAPDWSRVEEPFALRLAQAMDAELADRFNLMRTLGDDVLFLSGFFGEHLQERGLRASYTSSLGQSAYEGAAQTLRGVAGGPGVFDELAGEFDDLVEVLRHVSDSLLSQAVHESTGVLELYERWAKSGSDVLAQALADRGLVPMNTDGSLN